MRLSIIDQRPGQRLAFLPEPNPKEIAECLVAFANSDGGTIIVGVDDDGKPVAGLSSDEIEDALRLAASLCHPPVPSAWQASEVQDGEVVAIEIGRGMELHSLTDGRVFVRSGRYNRQLNGTEIGRLNATKNSADFETDRVPGADKSDFAQEMIEDYLAKREARGLSKIGSLDSLLFEIGALDPDGNPTVTGILLFARNPQAFLPQTGVVFVKFPGIEPRGEDGAAGYGRREEIVGPLAHVIERTWNVIWEEMRVGAVVKELEREDLTEYPPFAVREALVNAVAHRDYRIRGKRIEIRMYSDRLEIISPGDLPGYITVDNIVEEHFSRNPHIVHGLFQWGFIEELGLGIDRMIEEMVEAGHRPPKFRATPYSFTVTLSNIRQRKAVPRWTRSMNERQARALNYVQENGSITNRDYRKICPEVSAETVRLDLVDMVERGLLLKIGAKKGTYYILK